MKLWLSGNALVLSLAAALAFYGWFLSSALAVSWKVNRRLVAFPFVAVGFASPFVAGSGRLDTFWRAVMDRPAMAVPSVWELR